MSSIHATFNGRAIPVIILDFFTTNEQMAVVQSLDGRPFVGGTKEAIRTCFATVRLADLVIDQDDCSCVLPEQSCPACRAAAHKDHGALPFDEATK